MWTKAQTCASQVGEVRHLKLTLTGRDGAGDWTVAKSSWSILKSLHFSHRPGVGALSLKSFKETIHGLQGAHEHPKIISKICVSVNKGIFPGSTQKKKIKKPYDRR